MDLSTRNFANCMNQTDFVCLFPSSSRPNPNTRMLTMLATGSSLNPNSKPFAPRQNGGSNGGHCDSSSSKSTAVFYRPLPTYISSRVGASSSALERDTRRSSSYQAPHAAPVPVRPTPALASTSNTSSRPQAPPEPSSVSSSSPAVGILRNPFGANHNTGNKAVLSESNNRD